MLTGKFRRNHIKDFFANVVVFLLLFSLLVVGYAIWQSGVPWWYMGLAVPFAALYGVRLWVKRKNVFLAVHGGMLVLPFILPVAWPMRLMTGAFALVCVIYSIRARAHKEWRPDEKSVFKVLGILGVAYFLVSFIFDAGSADVERFFFATAMVTLSATVLIVQMDNIDERIAQLPDKLKRTTSLRGILSFNNRLISIFLGILMLFGALSLFSQGMWRLVRWGGYGVRTVLLLLFGIPGAIISIFIRQQADTGHSAIPRGDYWSQDWLEELITPEAIQAGEDAYQIVNQIYVVIFSILLLLVTVYGIYALIATLLKHFHKKNISDEDESLIPGDASGRLKFFFGDLAAFLPRFALSRHKVRRAYARKVNRHIKKGVPILQSDTPDKIADKIRPKENIDVLTSEYEQVRYGRGM